MRSPLICGGLEIPVEVCAIMANLNENTQALHRHIDFVNDHYEEPVGENFRDHTDSILGADDDDDDDSSSSESDNNGDYL